MTAFKQSQDGNAVLPDSAWIISAFGWLFKRNAVKLLFQCEAHLQALK
jgi:hypothetical protein